MGHFTTAAKRYREGTGYDSFGALDVNVTAPSTTVDQTAPATLPDGTATRKFLFWDTGRRVTNKRHVRWTFNHLDTWTTWNAIAWYGIPPTNGKGDPLVSFDAYWVGTGTLDPTPIDGPHSSFVNGPGAGEVAWPAGGNDHVVSTQWGPATIRALDHLRRTPSDPQLDFSSLTQLVYGGDDSSIFEENDDNLTAGDGVTGIASTTAQELAFAQGSGAVVLAGYVQPVPQKVDFGSRLIELVNEAALNHLVQTNVDPSPEDLVRLKLIVESLDLVRGERPSADVFEGLVGAAGQMSKAELKRAITETRSTLRRGESALKSMEAIAAKAGKSR